MATVKVNTVGINELDLNLAGTVTATTAAGVTTINQTGVGGVLLETNGIPNGSQTQLNLVAGTNVTITDDGTGDVTIAASGGGGGTVTAVTASSPLASSGGTTPNITLTSPLPVANGGTGTTSPAIVAGTNVTVSGAFPNQTVNATTQTATGAAGGVLAGTYPNPSFATPPVTAVTGTAPIVSSGGATPAISIAAATTSSLGAVQPDGTTITVSGGVISAVASSPFAKLGQVTVSGSSTTTVTFSSIPGTYSNLELNIYCGTSAAAADNVYIQMNGDNAAHYATAFIIGGNAANPAVAGGSSSALIAGSATSIAFVFQSLTAFSSAVAYIPAYASTASFKTALANSSRQNSATSGTTGTLSTQWQSTAAITSLTLGLGSGGHFPAGSVFTLYGKS